MAAPSASAPQPAAAAAKPSQMKQPPSDPKDKDKDKDKKSPMPNRADEPEFALEMALEIITFNCGDDKKPVYCDITIKNNTSDRHTFKVKCTSSEVFRVQPPLGFIKPGESQNIRVWFQNKTIPVDKDKHYFAFYHLKSTDTNVKEKDVWTKSTKPEGVRRLRAVFQEKK